MRSYVKTFLLTTCLTITFVAATNVIIDPFDVFRAVKIEGLTKTRRDADGARIATGFDIVRGEYRTLMLGSSRMQRMIKQPIAELPGEELNAGLAGANVYEIVRAGRLAFDNPKLECVYVALDFGSFSSVADIKGSYHTSPLAGGPIWLARIKVALSLDTLRRSFDTLRDQYKTKQEASLSPGEPRERFIAMTRNFLGVYRSHSYDPKRVEFLAAMIDRFTANGVQVIGMVSPVHAWNEEAMFAAGKGEDYLRWRRDVTHMFARFAGRPVRAGCATSKASAVIYDFAGYRTLSQTRVPDAQTDQPHAWYYESSHMTPLIGHAMILETIGKRPKFPFGAQVLTPANLAKSEKELFARQSAYRRSADAKTIAPLLESWKDDAPEPATRRFFLTDKDFEEVR